MKNIYIVLSVLFLGLISCEDFLSLPKEYEPSSGSYFGTASDFDKLVVAAYAPLRSVYGIDNFVCGEMRSDNTHYEYYIKQGGSEIGDRVAVCDFLDGSQNWYSNGLYNDCFTGVARTNVIISRMHDGIPEPTHTTAVAEAKFLRALYYYNLVRFFGKVPLHDKEVTSSEAASAPLAETSAIFSLIESDLNAAIEGLSVVSGFPQTGKATKGSAQTLLASVYLYQKKYSYAIPLLQSVTQQGYGLLGEYKDVFKTANKNSKESIFEVQFKEGSADGLYSSYLYYFLPKATTNEAIIGIPSSHTMTNGGCNVPTSDLLRTYETGDSRFEASVAVVEGVLDGENFISKKLVSPVNYVPTNGVPYRYMCNKYNNTHSVFMQTGDDWPVFRYSDVLLMLAECLNETGKSGDALTYLNQVRNRARLANVTQTDQTALRSVILHERRVELAFENQRWHDLVRTGNAISVMMAHGAEMKSLYSYLSSSAYTITTDKLVFPIPYRETLWNTDL